ncbi:hypothetical protein RchiOBHm_Chr5g0017131 [Rosa chinensis]|uniref:Uncharacterized protein n=1 Tax=Rosa chinensis TaxID=74649 RepID=A0A2P6Q6D9_ROSCH|nr:hypothetical protein RchiOBHm_Chr5g0017131 [Rosa chinensis]
MKTQRPGLDGGRRRHGGRKLYRFSISSNNGLGLSTSLEISVSPRRLSPKSQYLLDGSGPLLLSSTIEGLFHPRKPTALIESREMEQIQFNPGGLSFYLLSFLLFQFIYHLIVCYAAICEHPEREIGPT